MLSESKMAPAAQRCPICSAFVLKYEKSLNGRAVYRNRGRVWVTAKETVIVKGSSWREKMMGHIVVSSCSESTCCSINCDLTTTDYIKLRLHQTERWGFFFCQTKRKETNSKKLTQFDKIRPTPPVQDNESPSKITKICSIPLTQNRKLLFARTKTVCCGRVHKEQLGIKSWECFLKNSCVLCLQACRRRLKHNHFFVFFPL